jgi:hypothetical protein
MRSRGDGVYCGSVLRFCGAFAVLQLLQSSQVQAPRARSGVRGLLQATGQRLVQHRVATMCCTKTKSRLVHTISTVDHTILRPKKNYPVDGVGAADYKKQRLVS